MKFKVNVYLLYHYFLPSCTLLDFLSYTKIFPMELGLLPPSLILISVRKETIDYVNVLVEYLLMSYALLPSSSGSQRDTPLSSIYGPLIP